MLPPGVVRIVSLALAVTALLLVPSTVFATGIDFDGDGVDFFTELVNGCNDFSPDADGDGMSDRYELDSQFSCNNAADAAQDADGDGLTNVRELELGTMPRSAETDGDGLSDGDEVSAGTDPNNADSDGDGVFDGSDNCRTTSNPGQEDSGGDGVGDACSMASGDPPACGDARIPKSAGGYWTCTFADEFSGDSIDRNKWTPISTATMGLSYAGECFLDDPDHVNVADGYLTLTATRLSIPALCGWFSTAYQFGMVTSKYSQAYGRFEARLKFPRGPGFASGWWMWPRDMAYGVQSGEIDIAEHSGAYPSLVYPHTHIRDDAGGEAGTGVNCTVSDPSGSFHRYAVEWLPTGFKFLYDGKPCLIIDRWTPPIPLSFPQPFDQPFFMVLTVLLGFNENAVTPSTPFPGELQVDYVRVWN